MEQSRAIALLSSSDVAERVSAAEWLSQQADLDNAALTAVLDAVGDSDETVREWSVAALESAQPSANLESALIARLNAPSPDVVYWSITLLGRLGNDATDASSTALAQVLADESSALASRERAAWALGKTGRCSASMSALQNAAQSEHSRLASLARKAMG